MQFPPVAMPPDLDPAAGIEVHLFCGKDANANTVTLAVGAFFGVGDTNAGGNTPTIAQARARYKVAHRRRRRRRASRGAQHLR